MSASRAPRRCCGRRCWPSSCSAWRWAPATSSATTWSGCRTSRFVPTSWASAPAFPVRCPRTWWSPWSTRSFRECCCRRSSSSLALVLGGQRRVAPGPGRRLGGRRLRGHALRLEPVRRRAPGDRALAAAHDVRRAAVDPPLGPGVGRGRGVGGPPRALDRLRQPEPGGWRDLDRVRAAERGRPGFGCAATTGRDDGPLGCPQRPVDRGGRPPRLERTERPARGRGVRRPR